jgi:hypothetical protein
MTPFLPSALQSIATHVVRPYSIRKLHGWGVLYKLHAPKTLQSCLMFSDRPSSGKDIRSSNSSGSTGERHAQDSPQIWIEI